MATSTSYSTIKSENILTRHFLWSCLVYLHTLTFSLLVCPCFYQVSPQDHAEITSWNNHFLVLLAFGVKESTNFNALFTIINLYAVFYCIIAGSFRADIKNWFIPKSQVPAGFGEGGFFPFGFQGIFMARRRTILNFLQQAWWLVPQRVFMVSSGLMQLLVLEKRAKILKGRSLSVSRSHYFLYYSLTSE